MGIVRLVAWNIRTNPYKLRPEASDERQGRLREGGVPPTPDASPAHQIRNIDFQLDGKLSEMPMPDDGTSLKSAEIVDLTGLPGIACPCGTARRAFADRDDFPGTVHLTQIDRSAKTHYHKHHTEVYVILECEQDAAMELDGELQAVQPKSTILIPPGTRHRAVGKMEVLIVCLPKFDPADEHFD